MLPIFQSLSRPEAIEQVLAEHIGTIVHIDFIVKMLYGELEPDAFKVIKGRVQSNPTAFLPQPLDKDSLASPMTATLFLTVSKERIGIHYFYAIAWAWALEPGASIGYCLTYTFKIYGYSSSRVKNRAISKVFNRHSKRHECGNNRYQQIIS